MPAIKIENVSKKYIIKHLNNKGDSFRDVIYRTLKNPFQKSIKISKEEFWALNNIDLTINQGDRIGLIGSNGAGKSTLLKIISRITTPTTGKITIRGRLASLLEVGTGFHPELSGRENIHLNGAILGMSKHEIDKHFDAIVEFAGVEKFLDTPVKRYSSGMFVRLGFAIAAHLEPEILIVDEVLAVGDADFQKKSIGKMREVSKSGRTLIFVSHNLTAVQSLCDKGAFLQKGRIITKGNMTPVINSYVKTVSRFLLKQQWNEPKNAPGNDDIRVKKIELIKLIENEKDFIDTTTPLKLQFEYWNFFKNTNLNISLFLHNIAGECIFNVAHESKVHEQGIIETECEIPGNFLNDGSYYISVMVVKDNLKPAFFFEEAISFDVIDERGDSEWFGKWPGYIRPLGIKIDSNQKEILQLT